MQTTQLQNYRQSNCCSSGPEFIYVLKSNETANGQQPLYCYHKQECQRCRIIHTVHGKRVYDILGIMSFFHYHNLLKICSRVITEYLTAPQTRRYTLPQISKTGQYSLKLCHEYGRAYGRPFFRTRCRSIHHQYYALHIHIAHAYS